MNWDVAVLIVAVVGYLLGSLPFGYLVAKANGVDIFKVGSCSPGATNVKRSVGSKAGNLVFLLDFLKGFMAAGWPIVIHIGSGEYSFYGLIGMLGAVLGHSFSVFTRFRGGKGVASMLGGLVALMPWAALIGVVIWLALFYATRYVSVASIAMAVSLPISNALMGASWLLLGTAIVLALAVILRHHSNIGRLLRGEEHRFEPKSGKEKVSS